MTAAYHLAAIHAVDVVGYSRPMGKDEEGTCNLTEPAPKSGMVAVAVQPHRLCGPRRVQAPAQKPLTLCAERDAKATIFRGV
jgi:hypothetical protein